MRAINIEFHKHKNEFLLHLIFVAKCARAMLMIKSEHYIGYYDFGTTFFRCY